MQTFYEWVAQLNLFGETYFTFDPKEYNELFDKELGRVLERVRDPAHCRALERMKGCGWMAYIGAAVRHAGFRDYRDGQEKIHDVAVKLLTGTLFRGFDEERSGPMDLRFKNSVGNAVRNLIEKARNRRRLLPSIPIDQAAEPASMTAHDGGEKVIQDFRRLVKRRLGPLGVAVLDARLAGEETKSLVGRPDLGSPGKYAVKNAVQELKQLAREYAERLGDPAFLRDIEKAMGREEETIGKRRTSTAAARQAVGA